MLTLRLTIDIHRVPKVELNGTPSSDIESSKMYLTLTSIVQNLFNSGFEAPQVKSLDDEDHTYIRGDIVDRGPCPGLNALANQGFLYSPSSWECFEGRCTDV